MTTLWKDRIEKKTVCCDMHAGEGGGAGGSLDWGRAQPN